MTPQQTAPVSVVIPCYRCGATITRAVYSVEAQTLKPFEVILVEDAGGDDTVDVLQRLAQQYTGWIRIVVQKRNSGAASARNRGWEAASQPYIAFLDADDAWHPRKIEIQYAYMKAHPEVALCGHSHRLLLQKDALPDWAVSQPVEQPIHRWNMLLSNPFVTPSVMLRRETGQRFVERQRYMEDHMLWLKIIYGGGRVVKLSAELAAIYKRPFGITGLSAQFVSMERSDLGNYLRLYRADCIGAFLLGVLSIYSLLKYIRRLFMYWGYLRWRK